MDTPLLSEQPVQYILKPRQAKFVASYQLTGNATESAINAGYPAKNARIEGYRLLRNPKIVAELTKWKASRPETLSKDDYIGKAMERFERLPDEEPNAPRYLDIAGKALGYIGNTNDSRPSQSLTIINVDASGKSQLEIWELTRKLLDAS